MSNIINSKTGKNKTIWQALNEVEDEDILHTMGAIESIGIFLDASDEYNLYEYQQALKGWHFLNSVFNNQARERIEEYADKIEGDQYK